MQDIYYIMRIGLPVFLAILTWYIWSLKQKFVTRKEFDKYKEDITSKLSKQSEDIVEIKTELKHIGKSLDYIKNIISSYVKGSK